MKKWTIALLSILLLALTGCVSQEIQTTVPLKYEEVVSSGYEDVSCFLEYQDRIEIFSIDENSAVKLTLSLPYTAKEKLGKLYRLDENYKKDRYEIVKDLDVVSNQDLSGDILSDSKARFLLNKTGQELLNEGFAYRTAEWNGNECKYFFSYKGYIYEVVFSGINDYSYYYSFLDGTIEKIRFSHPE